MKQLIFIFLLSPLCCFCQDSVQIQFWDTIGHSGVTTANRITNPNWNKVAFVQSPAVLSSPALLLTTGVQSTITVAVNQINDHSNNGISYGASNTMGVPDTVLADAMYNSGNQIWTVSGLTNGQLYQLQIFSSASTGSSSFSEVFTSGSATQTIDGHNNLTTTVILDNLSPSSGVVTFTITGSFSIVNSMRIIRKQVTSGVKYYVDQIGGLDGNAGTISSPFQTLAKIKSITLNPGDSIFLKAGDSWHEVLYIQQSGTVANSIVYTRYGAGANPIVTGFVKKTTWNTYPGGYYGAACPECTSTTNLVTVDGIVQSWDKWPTTGYRRFYHITSSNFTDSTFPSNAPTVVNTSAVLKDEKYIIDSLHCTAASAGVFTLASAPTQTTLRGHGYFFMRARQFMGMGIAHEFFIDPATDSLFVNSSDAITGHDVEVGVFDTLAYFNHKNYVKIIGINFYGANQYNIFINADTNIEIDNSHMKFSGGNGMNVNAAPNLVMNSDTISRCNNNGMTVTNGSIRRKLINCYIHNNGTIPGMGHNGGGGTYEGVVSVGQGFSLYSGNEIDSNGYTGLNFGNDSNTIINNYFHNNGLIKSDGGDIYGIDQTVPSYIYGTNISRNTCSNGFNDTSGVLYDSSDVFFGGYLDGSRASVNLINNTFSNEPSSGVINHGSNNTINNNNFSDNIHSQFQMQEFSGVPITNIVFKNNQLAINGAELGVSILTPATDISSMAIIDSNWYASLSTLLFRTQSSSDPGTRRTIASWKTATSYDAAASNIIVNAYLVYNSGGSTKPITLYQVYSDIKGLNTYFRGATIPPYSSIVIKFKGNGYSQNKRGKPVVQ